MVGIAERETYLSVLRNREFAALLASQTLSIAGDHLARIAVAILVYDRTGSAFSASATYALSYLTYLLGGPWLSALSDRLPRVSVMVVCDVLRAPIVLGLCLTDIPLWLVFLLLGLVGALAPPFDSARSAIQPDLLSGDAYVRGNAMMQLVFQGAQVLGFAVGGALVASLGVRPTLALDAASFLVSAGLLLALLRPRSAAQQPEDRASVFSDTSAGVRLLRQQPTMRRLLLYALLGSAAVIAPEGLAVPVAAALGGGAREAGLLTASIPLGFLVGSVLVLRVEPDRRPPLLPSLALLGCVPLLATPLTQSLALTCLLWVIAGAGGAVNLIASSAYIQACPREFRSRAYGLAITALYAVQGGILLVAGWLAGPLGARESVALVALCTLTCVAFANKSP